MSTSLPMAGAASEELARQAHQHWKEAAAKAGVDLSGFHADAALTERLHWAQSQGLEIATVLSRFSSKMQHSTQSQVQDCVEYAGWHRMYPAPEFICADEAVSGRKIRRDGLDRVKLILQERLAQILLVFKVSRLFRVAYRGYAFFQEDIVEEGLRAISVSQGIDTKDEKTWKNLAYLHGLMDEMLLTSIADHARSGLKSLFLAGYVTGGLPVGYRPIMVPGAPPTNRGRPRTMPQVDPTVAALLRQHYAWIRDGMSLKEGWRRWVKADGPCDPRSTLGHMSYQAYRRALSNPRYTGVWAFGRKRNCWSSKRDYTRQVPQPDADVALHRCDELRIIDDELFAGVQRRLAEFKLGSRGPKKQKDVHLWDLTTEFFFCSHCQVRFHQGGAGGHGMVCKRADLCPAKSAVRRQDAVRSVCGKLSELLHRDTALIEQVVGRAQQIDAAGDEGLQAETATLEKKIAGWTGRINDLLEMVGQGTAQDRQETKSRLRTAQAQRAEAECELARLRKALMASREKITSEQTRRILADLTQLLEDGAVGRLGEDAVYKALAIFRGMIGGHIDVHVERRPGRKRTTARAVFQPSLLQTSRHQVDLPGGNDEPASKAEVWLRLPPRLDLLAGRVHQLMDVDGQSYRDAAATLQKEGYKVNSGNVWYSYRRYYTMQGLEVPKRAYNNGRPRRPV